MRLGSCVGGGARVCMRWDSQGVCGGGQSESEWVGIRGSLTLWHTNGGMTGSPHSRNGTQTTGLGLSLEAGPSATSV